MADAETATITELEALARFVLDARLEDVPDEVVEYARHLTLKTISGMVAGARFSPGPQMVELVRRKGLPEEVRVVGCDFRTSLWEGVFLSNFVAHATETEDDRLEHGVAWDIAIVPVILTLADKLGLSGRDTLAAIVIGLEVHSRSSDFDAAARGLYCVPAAVGTAAAAARVMGLTHEQTVNAMGMVLSTAMVTETNFGYDAHCLESAMQCLQAIMAVEAAAAGLSSNPDLRGYLDKLVGPENVFADGILAGLGETWSMMDICVKKYPACSCIHKPADALRELMREHGFGADDVESLVTEISPYDVFNDRPDPLSMGDAKFSYQHCLGAVLVDGDITFANIGAIDEPRYVQARAKVSINVHEDWSPLMLAAPNGVTVRLRDGRELQRIREHIHGSRPDPLSHEEFVDLFALYTDGILSADEVATCVDLVERLEELPHLGALLDVVAPVAP
ncbi:MmgE/PrpD family protein [Baekduia soli]|uniref:MmgE/PrpD family protein n=1 Tax=Baekduia soli TaxID=496014 RepID=A0A5B8U1V9_9ACTN|nr:MmgE/PrpD family protein [Baekduia soli]QEC47054.1 MmgE/PrpD family protein [Baekduia soli]